MSKEYDTDDEIPSDVICDRLDELAEIVQHGPDVVAKHFVMRIPGERDFDPDLVMLAASMRIRQLEEKIKNLEIKVDSLEMLSANV